jgi:hypothetical protein
LSGEWVNSPLRLAAEESTRESYDPEDPTLIDTRKSLGAWI